MKIETSGINAIISAAIAERDRLNEDLDNLLARARWKFQMQYPRPKAKLTLVKTE